MISCSNEGKVVEMKKLFKRSPLACLYICKLHLLVTLFDKCSVNCLGRATLNARMFFFCRMVFQTTQVALLFSDFLVVIVQ